MYDITDLSIPKIRLVVMHLILTTILRLTLPHFALMRRILRGAFCHSQYLPLVAKGADIGTFIKSFALPVGIAFAGGISGLVFLAKHLGNIWPYSLMAYGMNSNAPQEIMESGYVPFVITSILYIAVFVFIGSTILKKKEM